MCGGQSGGYALTLRARELEDDAGEPFRPDVLSRMCKPCGTEPDVAGSERVFHRRRTIERRARPAATDEDGQHVSGVAVRQRRLSGWNIQQENGQPFVAVNLVPERHFVRGNRCTLLCRGGGSGERQDGDKDVHVRRSIGEVHAPAIR